MSDILTIKTREFIDPITGDKTYTTSTYVSRLASGTLYINSLKKDEEGNDVEVLVMEQPWKCNPDGSRSNWQNNADAEAWLESIKHDMLS
jgi:hypothetical protein